LCVMKTIRARQNTTNHQHRSQQHIIHSCCHSRVNYMCALILVQGTQHQIKKAIKFSRTHTMPSTTRTIQCNDTTIKYTGPPNSTEIASFTFLINPPNHEDSITSSRLITIPPRSTWTTGLHWHEEYVERVRVLQGKARVTYDGVTKDYGPEDGILRFEKFIVHGFGRADSGGEIDTVIEEWTEPGESFEILFFPQ
jgi:hypothetical protein